MSYQLSQIVSNQVSEYLKNEINKVDLYFLMVLVADANKLDFTTASLKIKKEFDQKLRTFMEMNTLEENRKIA